MFTQNQGQQQQQGQGLFAQPQATQPQNQGLFAQVLVIQFLKISQHQERQHFRVNPTGKSPTRIGAKSTAWRPRAFHWPKSTAWRPRAFNWPKSTARQSKHVPWKPAAARYPEHVRARAREQPKHIGSTGIQPTGIFPKSSHSKNQGAFSNPLEEMQRMNAKSFLPSFGNDPQSKANKDSSMDTETPDLSDIKKFDFMYKQQPGTIFELSGKIFALLKMAIEMNNYKNKKVGELGQSIQDTIFEIDSWIKASRKKLDDLKKANQETKSQLEERLEVALQNNLSSLKNCNLQISTLGRQLSELHKEINYFTMVSDDFERYHVIFLLEGNKFSRNMSNRAHSRNTRSHRPT
jgi:hypothetical protein